MIAETREDWSKVSKVIGTLDINDANERFQKRMDRIVHGRANEMLYYEINHIFPSLYAELVHQTGLTYRYVREQKKTYLYNI